MSAEREAMLAALARTIAGVPVQPTRVAIDGPDAAGKTTLASELVPHVQAQGRPVLRASLDGFHRPRADRLARGDRSPEGYYLDSFDYGSLRSALLEPLGRNGDRRCRIAVFDYRTDEPVAAPELRVPDDVVLLFDGVFLQRPELAGCWDMVVFVSVPFDETLRRALARDRELFGDATRSRYLARYIPGQRLYYDAVQPETNADIVVENADLSLPRLRFQTIIRSRERQAPSPSGGGPGG